MVRDRKSTMYGSDERWLEREYAVVQQGETMYRGPWYTQRSGNARVQKGKLCASLKILKKAEPLVPSPPESYVHVKVLHKQLQFWNGPTNFLHCGSSFVSS